MREVLQSTPPAFNTLFLLQAEFLLHLSSDVGREGGTDVGDAGSHLHDIDITAGLADSLDGVEHLGSDGLHLLLLSLGQAV